MISPGFFYLMGALVLYLATNDKIKYIIAFLIAAGALIITLNLKTSYRLQLGFLNYTLMPLRVDKVSKLTGLIFTVSGLAAVIYSLKVSSRRVLRLIFLFIGSALSVVFAGDLFTLYVFWELMTISSSFIIIVESNLTKKAGYYFFIMQVAGGLCLLWGIFLQLAETGRLSLSSIEAGIPFFIIATGIKMAFIGLHIWLPLVYSRVPFYVAVVLSIYTTKVGVYVMYRLLPGINTLAYAGLISALSGIVMALRQTRVRKLLGYSIIIQVGYMIIGISTGTVVGIAGAFFHLFNHILFKTVLFMVVGVVIYTTGKESFRNLGIMGRKLPLTSVATLVAIMAIAGVPFFNGYMSKTIIKEAVREPVLKWGLDMMSFGSSLIFLKFIFYAFFLRSDIGINRKPTPSMRVGLGMLTVIMVLIGINPFLLENLTGINAGINYFDMEHMLSGIQPFLLSVPVFIIFKKYLVKKYEKILHIDIYFDIARIFTETGKKLSDFHDGKLDKYLLWATTTLVVLLLLLII